MNILLVKPYWPYPYNKSENTFNRFWPPLCLANCAGILKESGFNAKILDFHALRIRPEQINDYVRGFDKIFVTSSSLDKWQCPNPDISTFIKTCLQIRGLTQELYVMGYHGTVDPERILRQTKARAVIREEPENSILEICKDRKLSDIRGVSFFEGNELISTPENERLDLTKLPIPDFGSLDFKRYSYEILGKRFVLLEISRGCPFNCKFCNNTMYGQGIRKKKKEQVFQEISLAIEKYKAASGYFIDLNFLSSREIVDSLCDYLIQKKYKFKWACQTRPDSLDAGILKKMKAAGCRVIHLGVETYIQELLDLVDKRIKIEKIDQAIKLCRDAGIQTLAFVIFGLPGETEEDRACILAALKKINPDFVSFHKLFKFGKDNWEWGNFCDEGEIDRAVKQAFIKYYFRLSRIPQINPFLIYRCLKLFYGRIKTL